MSFWKTATSIVTNGYKGYTFVRDLISDSSQPPGQPPVDKNNADTEWSPTLKNLAFYRNEIPSKPNGAKIEEILSNWYGDYAKLKEKQFYIQWLFPNKEEGTNPHAPCLTEEEAFEIRSDPVLRNRFLKAFKMILDLYGMSLTTGNEIKLKDDDPAFLEHLKSHSPSAMWITRVLKSLKELGQQKFMVPWLKLLKEFIDEGHLPEKFGRSFNDFWIHTLDSTQKMILTNQ